MEALGPSTWSGAPSLEGDTVFVATIDATNIIAMDWLPMVIGPDLRS